MTAIPNAFGLWMVAALAVWVGVLWLLTRPLVRTRERLRCPVTRRMARVVFVRSPEGSRDDVARCSLLVGGAVCHKQCLEVSA